MKLTTYNSVIGIDRLREGQDLLSLYKRGKSQIEKRIIEDESFWNSRHSESYQASSSDMPAPASGWMFSAIINKHADILESVPAPICLAREESDVKAADTLNVILPVIFDRLSFNSTYSDAQYDKLKHGTAIYGVFWDPCAENGLGDIDIKRVDLLNLYSEPGVLNIQDSSNIFYVSHMNVDKLHEAYPWTVGSDIEKLSSTSYFASNDNDKCVVVDWYYKKKAGSRTLLHYIKFTGDTLLYASENDPAAQNGFYEHGRYPFVLDVLYSENTSPFGYGIISITKGAQKYIDRLDENILERSIMSSKPRYLMKKNVGLNRDEFANWNNPIVEVEGDLTEERFRPITLPELDGSILTVRDSKIDEMREISSNRMINYGDSRNLTSGVAIAALQEAGNKVSRDIISGSWSAYVSVVKIVIELIRQFYTEERCFRITRPNEDTYSFINFSGNILGEKETVIGDEVLYRLPVFDIEVRAQKTSVFSKLAQNETIINLYKLGFFDPENIEASIIALGQLELEGKKQIIDELRKINSGSSVFKHINDTTPGDVGVNENIQKVVHSSKKLYEDNLK